MRENHYVMKRSFSGRLQTVGMPFQGNTFCQTLPHRTKPDASLRSVSIALVLFISDIFFPIPIVMSKYSEE